MRVRRWITVTAVVTGVLTPLGVTWAQHTPPVSGERRDASGVVLLEPESRRTSQPMPEGTAQTLHDAFTYAEKHPDAVGYPWVDRGSGAVHVDGVGEAGADVARKFQPSRRGAEVRTRQVPRSFAALNRIKDESIDLTSGQLPGADSIVSTQIDGESGRVVIETRSASPAFLKGLAARYGTDAIAVRHDPNLPVLEAQSGSRRNDRSPFYGGAQISVPGGFICSSGFSWNVSTSYYMLTAGHCVPGGGGVRARDYLGWVYQYTRENWRNGVGTVYLRGQSAYRGDLALIKVTSGSRSAARIYSGGPTTTSYRTVIGRTGRRTAQGDPYCTSGRTTGSICGWRVSATRINVRYSGGEVVRNVTRGSKSGACTAGGDSGGSVYSRPSSSTARAVGIHSGGGGGGSYPCTEIFTDIWDAYFAFPGHIRA